jgi:hypothetical protein
MKLKLDRIVSIATLIAALTAIVLVLKKPAPVSPQAPTVVFQQSSATDHASAQPQPTQQSAPASGASDAFAPEVTASGQSTATAATGVSAAAPTAATTPRATATATTGSSSNSNSSSDAQGNSDAINAALAQMLGGAAGSAALSPDSNVGNGAPVIKDQQVTMEGDIVHGRFLTEIAGKDVWVTISGHMGDKDGYATFDPTEFKVGDTNIPVSVVNPMLQRKLAEERDRLKITGNSAQ